MCIGGNNSSTLMAAHVTNHKHCVLMSELHNMHMRVGHSLLLLWTLGLM